MSIGLTVDFAEEVQSEITPYQYLSGTEHVAPLLYSLIRMLRPETVVEFGTGYTTPFILRALKENAEDFKRHQKILKKKAIKNYSKLSDSQSRSIDDLEDWWQDDITQEVYGQEPILPKPDYYLKSYKPHLFSFEVLPAEDKYVEKLSRHVEQMKLDRYFTLYAGARVKNYVELLPEGRKTIDFAWNDFGNKHRFFSETYDSVNANGGIMAFHNTTNSELDFKEDLDMVLEEIETRVNKRECELMTFVEPHKFTQRSITLLKKLEQFNEEYYCENRLRFDNDLIKMSRMNTNQFP